MSALCGASAKSKSWEVSSSDIESVEPQLAPLLAVELRNTGSKELPRQYYRQYATGRLGKFHAIFVNGFHEDHRSAATDKSSWQHGAVGVPDGGDEYWCAIYAFPGGGSGRQMSRINWMESDGKLEVRIWVTFWVTAIIELALFVSK